MTWLSTALPYVGGGVLGAAMTYGLTWVRERRRTLDAYRAPQRQAIGDIVAATHALMIRELEARTAQNAVLNHVRRDALPTPEVLAALMTTGAELGKATLDAERAFQIGRLTIVDAFCWETMGEAYITLSSLRQAIAARVGAPDMESVNEVEQYVDHIKDLAARCNESVLRLVIAAADRMSPTETVRNRRQRQAARRRLSQRIANSTNPQ